MVRDLALPLELIVAPTTREADGLAMSSRNTYLSPSERQAATILIRSLRAAEQLWLAGEHSGDALRAAMHDVLASEPQATVDYVSIADRYNLTELTTIDATVGAWASLAVRIGRTRLIDNLILAPVE
jgi:pantoate--beta-alanine ligase